MFVARWNGEEIARSPHCILVENRLYFPPGSIRQGALRPAGGSSQCYWKGGEASYFDVLVAGAINPGAAWTYEETAPIARPIENWIAFWQGVETRWDGEGDGQPQVLEHAIPSVAKALGVDKVHWRPTLDIPGLEGEFTGYRVDSPPALVEIFAESGAHDRQTLIAMACRRALAVARYSDACARAGEPRLGYIAVWGSAFPSPGALEALKQGHAVIDLADAAHIISAADITPNKGEEQ
ncbi:DUF427 domain-containing protein [Sphingobium sp. RSMS]|uniref:DUF427 domain-containing protein n=1 Tax=Sphingobium sp. RSMS TaxID=520734 RepID=UPI0010FA4EB6|nr:DUF427 domain-containing protein [Sphingobium sp. RSMS]UXC91101.1 DUF427 domain-containing protein [Sphingobium sp. RSMS]